MRAYAHACAPLASSTAERTFALAVGTCSAEQSTQHPSRAASKGLFHEHYLEKLGIGGLPAHKWKWQTCSAALSYKWLLVALP